MDLNFLKWVRLIVIGCVLISSTDPLLSQKDVFNFGVEVGVMFSQIDGDNMTGFNKTGYEFSLNSGFNINESNEIVVATSFQRLGSSRDNERIPYVDDYYLIELDIQQVGLTFGYAFSYGENAFKFKQFRTLIALKTNVLIDVESNVIARKRPSTPDFVKQDFRSYYLSAKIATGINIGQHVILGFNFDMSLQNIIRTTDKFGVQSLRPTQIGLGLSYYF